MAKKLDKTAAAKRPAGGSDPFERLDGLARNLWWTWTPEAQQLFASLEPRDWEATNHSPLATLARLTPERREVLASDGEFLARLTRVESALDQYLSSTSWFSKQHRGATSDLLVAYFCAEFAIHESVPLYSGGLGVLAGDHLKSASDLGVPLVAVGLFYHQGYYRQELRRDGTTRVVRPRVKTDELPLLDTGVRIKVRIGKARVVAKVWKLQVGRVPVILLDTGLPENPPELRALTDQLYGGDNLYRIQQEVLLGIGGMAALDALGIRPTVYHLNEGHAAFCALDLLCRARQDGTALDRAMENVRQRVVFTTHTPVEAGHDRFEPDRAWEYLGGLAKSAQISRKELLGLGRVDPESEGESFCMTVLALRLSRHVNGVSELHGHVTREMWKSVYGGSSDEVPIAHITNGIHPQTWLAPDAVPFYEEHLRPKWHAATPTSDWWKEARDIPKEDLWALRNQLRRRLVMFVRRRLVEQLLRANASPTELIEAQNAFREDALTIGFARRFATYKRAPLVFRDRKRLIRLLSNPERPVQIVFAGKAHPADKDGQEFVRRIYEETQASDLRGRVVLLEDYDMNVGRMLTSGCDVWLNNPLRPLEASGTSGMKPPLHGGLNCSVLDGWWPEAYDGSNGWEIGGGQQFPTQEKQDAHDAKSLYELLEQEVVPTFFDRDRKDLPKRWLRLAARSMETVCSQFSTHRMVGDYTRQFYTTAHRAPSVRRSAAAKKATPRPPQGSRGLQVRSRER